MSNIDGRSTNSEKLSFGCFTIDDLMYGGLPRKKPALCFGHRMSGKTWLTWNLVANCLQKKEQGGFDQKVLWIETEGEYSEDEDFNRMWNHISKRFKLKDEDKDRIEIWTPPNMFDFGRLFGMEIVLEQKEKTVSSYVKFPRKKITYRTDKVGGKSKSVKVESDKESHGEAVPTEKGDYTKVTEQTGNWFVYSPVWQELEKGDYGLLAIDSFSMPIKTGISSDTPNLKARSGIVNPFVSFFLSVPDKLQVPVWSTHHEVKDPTQQKFWGEAWGGWIITYGTKRILNIKDFVSSTEPLAKTLKGTYFDKLRTIKRFRLTGVEEDTRTILLKKDYGFTDLPELLDDYKKRSLAPAPITSLTGS